MPDRAKRSSEAERSEVQNPIWIAYEIDWGSFAVFGAEVEALRFALDQSNEGRPMDVGVVERGEPTGTNMGIRRDLQS